MLVMSMNEGSEHASAAPAKKRRAISPAKLWTVACSIRKKPLARQYKTLLEFKNKMKVCPTPHEDINAQVLADWKLLHHEIGRKCPEQKAKIEHGTQPVIVRALQVQILPDAEDSCERRFISS